MITKTASQVKNELSLLLQKKIPIIDTNYIKYSKLINSKPHTKEISTLNAFHISLHDAIKKTISAWIKYVDYTVMNKIEYTYDGNVWPKSDSANSYGDYAEICDNICQIMDIVQNIIMYGQKSYNIQSGQKTTTLKLSNLAGYMEEWKNICKASETKWELTQHLPGSINVIKENYIFYDSIINTYSKFIDYITASKTPLLWNMSNVYDPTTVQKVTFLYNSSMTDFSDLINKLN